jgi:hypothetical protein
VTLRVTSTQAGETALTATASSLGNDDQPGDDQATMIIAATDPVATPEPALPSAPSRPAQTPSCVSRRSVTIHWALPRHAGRVTAVKVSVNGLRYATLRGRARKVTISMAGRPAQMVRVRIRATRSRGAALGGSRTYHTCGTGRPATRLTSLRLKALR